MVGIVDKDGSDERNTWYQGNGTDSDLALIIQNYSKVLSPLDV